GILIPPSVPMILYGVITNTSIGALFLAGILPGLMLALLLSLTVVVQVMLRPEDAPKITESVPARERLMATGEAAPIVIISLMVIGSIYAGIATPTEAGAVGAAAAILVSALMRKLKVIALRQALDRTVRTTGMFMLLLIGGIFSSFVLTRLGVPQGLSGFLTGLDVPPFVIIIAINIFLLILGMFMDPLSILVIVVPIFLHSVVGLGYDAIWFGILVTIQIEIAAISPPVGFNLFVLRAAAPGSTLTDAMMGSLIFIIPMLAGVGLLMLFPEIALFLPSLLR
ncbi:MAG: TRAP transporter large permease subunit, partial [Rhodobacteraceae bacterium]|nr:TRAP transporter large permease subunit [Paracoccaceae bacterium]